MINARAETLAQKSSFRKSLKARRCLVLVDGFYEWCKVKGSRTKVPMRFVLKSREPFAFAGLWDTWEKPDGGELQSFTIITTEANELLGPVHDRMPVILRQEDDDMCLDLDLKDVGKLLPVLRPYPSEKMEAYQVSTLVNSPKNDTPECIVDLSSHGMDEVDDLSDKVSRIYIATLVVTLLYWVRSFSTTWID